MKEAAVRIFTAGFFTCITWLVQAAAGAFYTCVFYMKGGTDMSWQWDKFWMVTGGFLLGTAGVKLLGSQDAKKAYTHTTAAVLRMKDEVVKDYTILAENCSDIVAGAQDINARRTEEYEKKMIEDAKRVLEEAAAKENAAEA